MPFIPILECALITAQFQDAEGVIAINRHYAATPTLPTSTQLEAIANLYSDSFTENMLGITTSKWALTGVVVRSMNDAEAPEFVLSDGLPIHGTITSGFLPNQVSYTVTWITGFVGRSQRGRTYGVGLPNEFVAAGQKRLTDDAQAGIQTDWSAMLNAFDTGGFPLQVVSLSSGGVPRTEGQKLPIVSARVNFPLATQRRRLR